MSHVPPILGVAEIVLSVADLPAMKDFYTSVLGFRLHSQASLETPVEDPHGEPTISFLVIQETETPLGRHGHPQLLALIDYRRHVYARSRLTGHDVRQTTLNHLAFEVPLECLDQHAQRLSELGIDWTETEFPNMRARAIFFKDPEGNVLEFICHSGQEPQGP